MSLIVCSADCKYQKDGYCGLDVPGAVTNLTHLGCVHYIPKQKSSELGPVEIQNGQK